MPHDSFDEIIDLVDIFYNNNRRLVINKFTPPSVIEEVRDRLLETVSGLDIMLKQTDEMRLRPDVSVFEYVKDVYPHDSVMYNQNDWVYDVLDSSAL
jgi:nicotinamide mononucleotide adenylyltransferase